MAVSVESWLLLSRQRETGANDDGKRRGSSRRMAGEGTQAGRQSQ
jgi:hypothetical protein